MSNFFALNKLEIEILAEGVAKELRCNFEIDADSHVVLLYTNFDKVEAYLKSVGFTTEKGEYTNGRVLLSTAAIDAKSCALKVLAGVNSHCERFFNKLLKATKEAGIKSRVNNEKYKNNKSFKFFCTGPELAAAMVTAGMGVKNLDLNEKRLHLELYADTYTVTSDAKGIEVVANIKD